VTSFLEQVCRENPQPLKVVPRHREPWSADSIAASETFGFLVDTIRDFGPMWRAVRHTPERKECADRLENRLRFSIDYLKARFEGWRPPRNAKAN
jgi:hypothetical protein